jgi:hypothetical protein
MKSSNPLLSITACLCFAAILLTGRQSFASGFQEITIGGQPTGERASYVVRDGVLPSVPFVLPDGEGHAGLLTGVSQDQNGNLVYEIRGGGKFVQLSKFYPNESWGGAESFIENYNFKGCGYPPYVDGLSDSQKKVYLEEVDAQAWRALGRPYVEWHEIATVWQYDDGKDTGVTYIAGGVPQVPDRFRCDGLVEWSYEAAQAIVTGAADGQIDPSWGVYNATGLWPFTRNDGLTSSPSDLFAPYGAGFYYQTSETVPDLPSMKGAEGQRGYVPEPTIDPATKTYSVTWTEPFDLSGVFQYAYGWFPTEISWGNFGSFSYTTSKNVANAPMPNQPGTYRFAVMAMDKLGHWSGLAETFEGVPRQWPPATAAPTILSHPVSQTAYLGQSVTFSVTASGVAPLNYQWMEAGVDIPSATGSTITIPNVTEADSGRSFSVRVTNPQGSVTSSTAFLTVSTSLDTGEPNDSSLTGTPLPMGSSRNGYISSPTDVDWFKVVVDKTGLLTVALTVPSGMDYDLEIYGPDYLWESGSYGLAGQNERIDISLLQTGTYYVRVYGYPVGAGAYDENRPYQISAGLEVATSGVIDTAMTWAETVELTGDVVIAPGGSLTILPGTQIRIPKSDDQAGGNNVNITEIIVNGGSLIAVGTASEPIVFTSARSPKSAGDWYGIRVKGGDVSLQHCVVEYAAEGIRFEDADTRFETYALSEVTVRYCTGNGLWTTSGQYAQPVVLSGFGVIGCGTGLRAEGPVTMNGGSVSHSGGDGFYVYYTTLVADSVVFTLNGSDGVAQTRGDTQLTGCTLSYNNGHGLYNDEGRTTLTACTVQNNNNWGFYGDWNYPSSGSGTVELSGNTVQNNASGGVRLYYSVTAGLADNVVSGNGGDGLYLYLYDYDGPAGVSSTGITGNSIFGNAGVGIRIGGNQPPVLTLSGNDIYDNTGFEIRNESGISITAENVYLGKETATEFGKQDNLSRIYDQHDHPAYGQVIVLSVNVGTMLLPPAITTQPQSVAVNLGGIATLSVAATGSGPITYQWYRNGVAINGATSSSLTLSNFDISKAGAYHAVAANIVDEDISDIAQVSAILPPDPSEPNKLELGRFYGYFTIAIRGEIGRAYTIQTSDDLIHWEDFETLILTENPQTYLDWESPQKSKRFYRAVYDQ